MNRATGRVPAPDDPEISADDPGSELVHSSPLGRGTVGRVQPRNPNPSRDETGRGRDELGRGEETGHPPAPSVLSEEARAEAVHDLTRWLIRQGTEQGLTPRQAQERADLIVSGMLAPRSVLSASDAPARSDDSAES